MNSALLVLPLLHFVSQLVGDEELNSFLDNHTFVAILLDYD